MGVILTGDFLYHILVLVQRGYLVNSMDSFGGFPVRGKKVEENPGVEFLGRKTLVNPGKPQRICVFPGSLGGFKAYWERGTRMVTKRGLFKGD